MKGQASRSLNKLYSLPAIFLVQNVDLISFPRVLLHIISFPFIPCLPLKTVFFLGQRVVGYQLLLVVTPQLDEVRSLFRPKKV